MKQEKSDGGKVLDGFLALCNLALTFTMWIGKIMWKFILFLGAVAEKKFSESNKKPRKSRSKKNGK